jgi:amidase
VADLLTEPCQTQRSALQGRKVSSRELLAATFARIDAINPLVNAVIAEDRATAQIAKPPAIIQSHYMIRM